MKRLLIMTTVLLALAAPSAFACQGCQPDNTCADGSSAWCIEHPDFCSEGGGCFAPTKPAPSVTPFNANWQVAAVERLEPARKAAKSDAPKIASLEKVPAKR